MIASTLAKLRTETHQSLTSPSGAPMDLPRGVAARIDAVDLRQVLDEREALLVALTELVTVRDQKGYHGSPDGTDGRYARARAALAKAGAP